VGAGLNQLANIEIMTINTRVARIASAITGCLVFGILMAYRGEADSVAVRAVIAAVAGAVLGTTLMLAQRYTSK
jgi:hypothetical protein